MDMVGWLLEEERSSWRLQLNQTNLMGLRVLRAGVPRPLSEKRLLRRLDRAAARLARAGVRRTLAAPGFSHWGLLAEYGLRPVDPEPLCQALAAPLALAELARQGIPPAAGTVALAGRRVNRPLFQAALALCPQVRTLIIDVPSGGTELADYLRREFGAAALTASSAARPQATVCFAGERTAPGALYLCGPAPELAGFQLRPPSAVPPEAESLPLLALLWEAGLLSAGDIQIVPAPLSLPAGTASSGSPLT